MCFPQDPVRLTSEQQLQQCIEESLEQYRKANPFAVLNQAQLRKPRVVEDLEKGEKPLVLVNPTRGWDAGNDGRWDGGKRNQTLLQWMVAKATYAPNVSIAKDELRSLLTKGHFIPHLPPTLFDRLKQQLKHRMHDLGKDLQELPADAKGVDLTFRLPQFMHPCTKGKPQYDPRSSPDGYRASQLTVLPVALKDGLDQALLLPVTSVLVLACNVAVLNGGILGIFGSRRR